MTCQCGEIDECAVEVSHGCVDVGLPPEKRKEGIKEDECKHRRENALEAFLIE